MKIPKVVFAAKSLAVVAVVAGVATAGFDIKESKATLTAPTGKCGFLMTVKANGFNQRYEGEDKASSSIGVVDFDAGTLNYVDTRVSNWGMPDAISTTTSGSETFTVTAGDYAGQYVMNLSRGGKFKMMSTNTANTYLLQGLPNNTSNGAVMTGSCQAL